MRFFVVSFVTGVWYYNSDGLAAQDADGGLTSAGLTGAAGMELGKPITALASGATDDSGGSRRATSSPICTGLGLAFSKSFGSVAFASLILAICEYLRRLAKKQNKCNLVGLLIYCCIMCILNYLEFLTRFALTFHALSGESFCASGQAFLEHQTRHGFTALAVDTLAAITFNFGAFVLAGALTAITVVGINADPASKLENDYKYPLLCTFGIISWLVAWALLHFIVSILLNIIDAAYACLVLDLDNAKQTNTYRQPEMAQCILAKANPTFVLVQAPGGVVNIAQPVGAPPGQAVGPGQVVVNVTQPVAQPVAVPIVQVAQPVAPPVAVAQPVAAPPQMMTVQATVPGGQTMSINVNGQALAVQVPLGLQVGQQFSFQLG